MEFKDLLSKKKSQLMEIAENEGYDFGHQTRKAIIAKELADDVVDTDDYTDPSEKSDSWQEEFKEACEQALRRTLEENRSYHVFEKSKGENIFNIAPAYMEWNDELKNPLLTIIRYAK